MDLSSVPTHSPYLASSDFNFFGTLKDANHKKGFGSDDKIVEKAKK
jgi:hypothetical protein